jgi:hypothetical protein
VLLGCRVAHPHQAAANSTSTGRNRRIPAWSNIANRNLSSKANTSDSRRRHGTTCARSCHHLGSLASPNKYLANSSFSAGKVGQSDRLFDLSASDARPATPRRSIHLNTNFSLALRRTASFRPLFNSAGCSPAPTDPISTRRAGLTHPQPNDFSGRTNRVRAIAWTVATHGIAPGRPSGTSLTFTKPPPKFTSQISARQLASARRTGARVIPLKEKTRCDVPLYSPSATSDGRHFPQDSPVRAPIFNVSRQGL